MVLLRDRSVTFSRLWLIVSSLRIRNGVNRRLPLMMIYRAWWSKGPSINVVLIQDENGHPGNSEIRNKDLIGCVAQITHSDSQISRKVLLWLTWDTIERYLKYSLLLCIWNDNKYEFYPLRYFSLIIWFNFYEC